MERENTKLASGEIKINPSLVEQALRSPEVATTIAIVGTVVAIVLALRDDWSLTVATLACSFALSVPGPIINFYARRLREQYELDSKRLREQHEIELLTSRKKLEEINERNAEATEALHKYVHRARDCAAQFVSTYELLLTKSAKGETDSTKCEGEFRKLIRGDFLRPMLEEMLRVFYPLVPHNANLWAAIRELQPDADGKHYYRTIVRAGAVNQDRAVTSEPVLETDGLPSHLRREHSQGSGIVLLSKKRPSDKWRATKNDERNEDVDVMAGPIFLKRTLVPEMIMILYLNSPRAGALSDEHKVYMKCCTDVLSMFFNTISSVMVMEFHAHLPKTT